MMINFFLRLFHWQEWEMLDSAWTCSLDELADRIEFLYHLARHQVRRSVKEAALWRMRRLLWEILWTRIENSG
jgi:hypothetical protein